MSLPHQSVVVRSRKPRGIPNPSPRRITSFLLKPSLRKVESSSLFPSILTLIIPRYIPESETNSTGCSGRNALTNTIDVKSDHFLIAKPPLLSSYLSSNLAQIFTNWAPNLSVKRLSMESLRT